MTNHRKHDFAINAECFICINDIIVIFIYGKLDARIF